MAIDVLFIDSPPRKDLQEVYSTYSNGHALLTGKSDKNDLHIDFSIPNWVAYLYPIVKKWGLSAELYCPALDSEKVPEAKLYLISCFTANYISACELAEELKLEYPESFIVLGGFHATCAPHECLNDGVFDIIVIGDGEGPLNGILNYVFFKGQTLDTIPGIGFCFGTNNVLNTFECYDNFTNEHFPDYGLIDTEIRSHVREVRMRTSKGCGGRCAYCIDANIDPKFKLADRFALELDNLKNFFPNMNFIHIDDCQFTKRREAEVFFDILRDFGVPWSCQSRADQLNDNILQTMLDSGCKVLRIGAESARDDILKKVNKSITNEKVFRGCKMAKNFGFKVKTFWMVGLPDESLDTGNATIDSAISGIQNGFIDVAELYICVPYPGTPLYVMPWKYNIRIEKQPFFQNFLEYGVSCTHTRYLSNTEIHKLWCEGIQRISSVYPTESCC